MAILLNLVKPYIARIKMEKMPTFCRCFINLQKVHDSEDSKLATVGSSIIRQRAAPNCVALAALV